MTLFDGVCETEKEPDAAADPVADPCPACDGTGKGNPLPPSRYGPPPCIRCGGTGTRPLAPTHRTT